MHTRQERSSAEDVKTVLAVPDAREQDQDNVREKRRKEEVKAENDARTELPFSGSLAASNEKEPFSKTIIV